MEFSYDLFGRFSEDEGKYMGGGAGSPLSLVPILQLTRPVEIYNSEVHSFVLESATKLHCFTYLLARLKTKAVSDKTTTLSVHPVRFNCRKLESARKILSLR